MRYWLMLTVPTLSAGCVLLICSTGTIAQLLSVIFMLHMLRIEVCCSRPQRKQGEHAILEVVVSTDETIPDFMSIWATSGMCG